MTTCQKNIYPAESADVKHFISGEKKRNDHYLHAVIRFDRNVDIGLLKKAVQATFKAVPLLTCRFVESDRKAFWEDAEWTADDMVFLIKSTDRERDVQDNLVIKPDEKVGPQLRITVIRDEEADTLAIILNHMICDGGGIRDYLYLLSKCYSAFAVDPDHAIVDMPDPGLRSIHQVFGSMSPEQMGRIRNAELQSYPQSEKDHLPLTGDAQHPFIITHQLPAAQFDLIKDYAKTRGATVNDALFAAYVCALSDALKTDRIVLDCPVNIRAYLPKGHQPGICNLTSNIICAVPSHAGESFDEALMSVKKVMDQQKGNLEPLKVYWDLEEVYQTLPLSEAKKRFPQIYSIPFNGMTNIGILDDKQLYFNGLRVEDALISGSIKYAPYFQIAVTTFRKAMTFSTNFHGTDDDYRWLDNFVNKMIGYFPK